MATQGSTISISPALPDIFAAQAARKSPGLLAMAWRRYRRDRLAMAGTIVLFFFAFMAIFATPLSDNVTHFSPERVQPLYSLKPMGWQRNADTPTNWLGTDDLGRDVLTRLIFGAQVSLFISLLTVSLTLTIGTLSGALAGYFGGLVDLVVSRLIDILLSIPVFFLLVFIAVVFQPPWWGLAIVLASVSWMGVARLVRGEFLSIRERDYVESARVVGSSNPRIIFRHILPNATSPLIVAATLQIGNVILVETALSYLGLGVQPPTASWGNMLTNAQRFLDIESARGMIIMPGVFIFLTVLAVNFIGNGLRDALDPRLKQ